MQENYIKTITELKALIESLTTELSGARHIENTSSLRRARVLTNKIAKKMKEFRATSLELEKNS